MQAVIEPFYVEKAKENEMKSEIEISGEIPRYDSGSGNPSYEASSILPSTDPFRFIPPNMLGNTL